jgi:hypothetical protein
MSSTDKTGGNKDDLTKKDFATILRYSKEGKMTPDKHKEVVTAYYNPYIEAYQIGIHGIKTVFDLDYIFIEKSDVLKFLKEHTNKDSYIIVGESLVKYLDEKGFNYHEKSEIENV